MNLDDHDLIARLQRLVKTERKITHLILECIAEIDRRRIYLDRAYPSLFEFLVKEFGYSPAAAMRRIDGARLLRELPEVSEKIQEGSINLTQISQLQQAVRLVQKSENRKMDVVEKREVLSRLDGATYKATEMILAQAWNTPIEIKDSVKTHGDESVTLTIHFTKEQMSLLQEVQNEVAHSVPSGKWSDLFVYLAEKQKVSTKRQSQEIGDFVQTESKNPRPRGQELQELKTITPSVRQLKLRDAKFECEYIDPATREKCASKRFLQIDHIVPKWAGGENDRENLQVLCGPHNRHKFGYSKSVT